MSKQQPMDGKSKDLKAEKLEALKKQFPELFSESKLDVEKLKQSLDEDVVTGDERYRLEWAGKHKVFEEIAKRTTATLTPDIEQSVDFDTSKNVFIEGENLEVLRVLQKAYYNKVKMIYIDPPYNTGKDFVYNDNFRETIAEYDEAAGNLDENGNLARAFTLNSKDSGQYHSNWLNMMYPRLFLARNFLREDGVIFVSIDDNEVHNLRMLMNEVFGEENFVAEFVWRKGAGTQNDNKYIPISHEYVLCFVKNKENIKTKFYNLPPTPEMLKQYKFSDKHVLLRGKYSLRNLNDFSIGDRPGLHYDIQCPDGTILQGNNHRWRCDKDRFNWRLAEDRIVFEKTKDGTWQVFYKQYINEQKETIEKDEEGNLLSYGKKSDALLYDIAFTGDGKKDAEKLFEKSYFDYPKPVTFLKYLITIGTKNNDIILDFFAGSGTTAQAIMQLNTEDGGNRKFICVQLPEATPEDSESRKKGYENIAHIAVERIKRAAKKIKEENPDFKGDLGVKVYKQTASHFPAWRAESFESDEALQLNLGSFAEQKAVGEAGARAIELLLKLGYDLNTELEEKAGYYSAAKGEVLLVVDEKAKVDLEKLLTEKPSVVVVLEDVFKGDDAKINFALACKEKNVTFQTV